LSTAVTSASLARRFGGTQSDDEPAEAVARAQAAYLSCFRADSIVRDCEQVRHVLCPRHPPAAHGGSTTTITSSTNSDDPADGANDDGSSSKSSSGISSTANDVETSRPVTLLGQSFGGFVALSYLSAYPRAIERCLLTCGLAPIGRSHEEVHHTHPRLF
jgi:pimeloyl-ACP methyl ester carboxylesterase